MSFLRKISQFFSGSESSPNKGSPQVSERQEQAFRIYQLLEMQKTLFISNGALPQSAKSEEGAGYVLGFSDALCQHMGVSEDEDMMVHAIVFSLCFEDSQEARILFERAIDKAADESSSTFKGMIRGGTEISKYLHASEEGSDQKWPPMGWFAIATEREK